MLDANATSLITGLAAIAVALLVITAYGWRWRPGETARSWFAHGIFAGFLALSLNSFYWSVVVRLAAMADAHVMVAFLRYHGGYADLVFKGLGCWAGYCHLRAVWLDTPEADRGDWSVLAIAFYPDRSNVIARVLNSIRRR